MKTEDILEGIKQALCRKELSAHIDILEIALERGECDYGDLEWLKIASAIDSKTNEFNQRVFH